jgi:hypothetical protein
VTKLATATVGPYVLVRPHRSKLIRIYTVFYRTEDLLLPHNRIATMVFVTAPDAGLPEEWLIRCAECDARKFYPERDRALGWLSTHRITKHV